MMRIPRRALSQAIASSRGCELTLKDVSHGLRDKSADCRRAHVVGWIRILDMFESRPAGRPCQLGNQIKAFCAVGLADHLATWP
jgi:hypothetical protein